MSFKGLSSSSSSSSRRTGSTSSNKDEAETPFKMVMIGDSGVGKSCLLEKLLDLSSTNAFISTIGVDVRTHMVAVNGHTFKLQVWDTGGQQRYRPVLATCYRNVHGIILVFDVTNAKSFNNLAQWLREVQEFAGAGDAHDEGGVAKLLVGNKSDLADRRQVDRPRAEAFARQNAMAYIETSAVDTVNIREAFTTLVQSSRQMPAALAASAVRSDATTPATVGAET